jgi:hypothetical protein
MQFLLENSHFAINLFAALVFFAVGWLYLDAWLETKETKEILKFAGFFLLSFAFLLHSTYIEQAVFAGSILGTNYLELIATGAKFLAYLILIIGLIVDPNQKKPVYKDQVEDKALAVGIMSLPGLTVLVGAICFPVLSLTVFLLYLRRATLGLENHLKPVTVGLGFVFLYELLSITNALQSVNNISIYNIVKPFGPIWITAHLLLLIGVVIIAKWVFQYLLQRLQTEIFMIFNISVLVIFLVTTVSFTGLLLNNLRSDALLHLGRDASVVQYAINSKQAETLSDAEVVSENSNLLTAVNARDKKALSGIATSVLLAKKQAFLTIVASSGAVLMRGEDNEKTGDSLSSNPLFIRAMRGEKASSVSTTDGPIAPIVSISSAVPIVSDGVAIGVVIVGNNIDNAFVDGLKATTKLDVSVYADNVLSATTFVAADGKSRYVGIKEADKNVNKTVLIEGNSYSGEIDILNVPYFAAFTPLKDVNGNPVGMLFAGEQQVSIIQAATNSIEYTFIIAVIFLLISVFPSFLISRFITNQFK